jgi:hypothetical protein
MPSTITRSIESNSEPMALYNILANVNNIPRWAPIFADSVESIDPTHYRVTKNGESFNLELLLHPSAGTVDYIREMPNKKRGGAYIRVTPLPIDGSVVTMTVPIGPGATEVDVAKTLEQELSELMRLVSS